MRYLYIFSGMLMAGTMTAQTYVDAVRFNQCDYEGTARSQAMGSAFGALGADLTSQAINPAGLGTYRAIEMAIGLGVDVNKTNTNYYGFETEKNKASVPFTVLGLALNLKNSNESSLIKRHAVSLSYSRLADYNSNAIYKDMYGYNSLLDYFCLTYNPQTTNNDPRGSKLAYEARWIWDPYSDENDNITFPTNSWEMPYGNNNLDLAAREEFDDKGNSRGLIDHKQRVKQHGYKGEVSFGYAMNINDIVYLGGNMGLQTLFFKEEVNHHEEYYGIPYDNHYNNFTYNSTLKQDGTGINFKIGTIIKPVNAIRLGFALHSPTFFTIDEHNCAWIEGADPNKADRYFSPEDNYEYRYRTPGKIVASFAGIVGTRAIISFDYERMDGKKSKFKDNEDEYDEEYFERQTELTQSVMDVSNTFRFGAEVRVLEGLSVRGGYNFQTEPTIKGIQISDYKHNAVTFGLGYRRNNFFVDASFVIRKSNYDRWVLPDYIDENGNDGYCYDPAGNQPASVESKRGNGTVTIGWRF